MAIRTWGATTLLILLASSGFARALAAGAPENTTKLTPTDLSTIRGANYRGAGAADTTDYWRHYNASETERDLAYADRLRLNQLRVFVNDARWGNVHGVFYPDGTVRDPSIPMAVLGIFRNRGPDIVLEQPDREGRVTREIADARKWLADPNADWNAGLDIAEAAANLLESAQLVPLRELPTRQVAILRRGPENRAALRALLEKDMAALQPYANQ